MVSLVAAGSQRSSPSDCAFVSASQLSSSVVSERMVLTPKAVRQEGLDLSGVTLVRGTPSAKKR